MCSQSAGGRIVRGHASVCVLWGGGFCGSLVPVQPCVYSWAACWCLALFVSTCLKRGKFKCCTFSERVDIQSEREG